jgi:hypothetical protein
LLLDGLDKIGNFFYEWVHCLAGDGAALTGESASRARPKQSFPDNGAIIPIEFQPIPATKHYRNAHLREQAVWIVQDQGGDFLVLIRTHKVMRASMKK